MADDITLTVRVRDMTRGDFNRLDNQLDRMRRSLQGVNRTTASQGEHSKRLAKDIDNLSNKFQRMSQTGNLTTRELRGMKGMLDAMSRSALNAARSGEITADRYNELNSEIGGLRQQFAHLGRGLDDNTNRLRNNNNQVNTTIRSVNGLVRSVNTTTRTMNGNTRHINTFSQTLGTLDGASRRSSVGVKFMGGAFSNLRQKGIGLAVVLAASVLPTIGALAPMLVGLIVVGAGAALAFDDLKKAAKKLKPEFKEMQKVASKAITPHLGKVVENTKKAMEKLHPVVKIGADTFGELLEKTSKGLSSDKFMKPFTQNARMGSKWVLEFAGSFGTFTTKFLEFGTKSQPALDAWQKLLGGFLDTGMPNMFKELENGIGGSSEYLQDFAEFLNTSLLPTLAKVIAGFMKTFGPFLGETMKLAGNALKLFGGLFTAGMESLAPVAHTVADAFKALNEVFSIGLSVGGSLAKVLGNALLGALGEVSGTKFTEMKDGFQGFSTWVQENATPIRMTFIGISQSIIDMVDVGVQAMPLLIGAFSDLTSMVLTTFDTIISSAATLFGDLPGMGWLKDANRDFDAFASGVREKLGAAEQKAKDFSKALSPRLKSASLELDVEQAKANLEYIKQKLKDPDLTKERKAKLTADKSAAERKLAEAKSALANFSSKQAKAKIDANDGSFWGKIRKAAAARIPKKTGNVDANTGGFWARVRALSGRVVGTSFINVKERFIASSYDSRAASKFGASGGLASSLPMKRFAGGGGVSGGVLEGPGTKTSDSLIARLSRGEFVMQARAVDKYGANFMRAVNSGRLRLPGFKKGGMSDSMKDARNSLADSFGISHFGRKAGYQRTPFTKGIAAPADMSALVSALNAARGDIKKAFSGRTESKLLKQLDSSGKALIGWQKKLSTVNKALDKAKESLSELKSEAKQLSESVKTGLMGEANITKGASSEDSQVTINTLLSNMTASAANTKQFSSMLSQLKSKGLSGELIAQIGEAGIAGGGMETAAAILGGGSAEIKRLNDLQKQIGSSAASAAKTTSDAMYAAGIKAAEGLIKGLTSQQDKIEAAMMRIAKSMEKAIKKALGIKSPSKVMMDVGHNTAEGFALGVQKNKKVDHSWMSMLDRPRNAPGGKYSAGGGSGPGGGPMVVQINVGGKNVGELLIDPLRKSISHRGGNVQAVLGK